jgi:hypothetical protein
MGMENIEQIADVESPKSVGETRVKNTKKIFRDVKMCLIYKDMECRIPVCDMKACEKCNNGHVYCTRVAFIKNMLQKVFMFLMVLLVISES